MNARGLLQVIAEPKAVRKAHEVHAFNAPSSKHGLAVRISARMGVHGDTTGRDYEASNVNRSASPHKLCRGQLGRMSAAALGKACAEVDGSTRRVIVTPWESSLSACVSSLFDPTLGGGGVFMKRGESRAFQQGDTVMCQHRCAANNTGWYGRLGYRSLSALETYRADLVENMLTCANGPWTLLPSKPSSVRRRSHLVRNVPQLARTMPRQQSRTTWDQFTPDIVFGNFRKFKSCSLNFDAANVHEREKNLFSAQPGQTSRHGKVIYICIYIYAYMHICIYI